MLISSDIPLIILDTNVVSEVLKSDPDTAVLGWLDRQIAETLYLTSVSMAELLLGVALLPAGKRRSGLSDNLERLLARLFDSRILPFHSPAAGTYAKLVATAKSHGVSISVSDGQIAAICAVHGYFIATRDMRPFLAAGLAVTNPWDE